MTEPMDLVYKQEIADNAANLPELSVYAETMHELLDIVRQQRTALIEALGLLESVIRQQVNLPDAAFTARHVLMAAVALTTDDEDGA